VSGCVGGVGVVGCRLVRRVCVLVCAVLSATKGVLPWSSQGAKRCAYSALTGISDRLARSTFGKAKPKVLRCRSSHSWLAGLLEGT